MLAVFASYLDILDVFKGCLSDPRVRQIAWKAARS